MEGIDKIINSKSKTFLTFCFCFILGITACSLFNIDKEYQFYIFVVILFLLFIFIVSRLSFPRRRESSFVFLCLIFFVFGIFRVLIFLPDITPQHIAYYNGQEVEFIGKVAEEPDSRIDKVYYLVHSQKFLVSSSDVNGLVRVMAPLYPQYNYGDILQIKCKLQRPENFEDSKFRFDKYLALQQVYSVCYFPEVSVASEQSPASGYKGFLFDKIFKLKTVVSEQINRLWPEPSASLIAGLLYGYRGGLPEDLMENFNKTGLTHIIAISGFNISIISVFLMIVLIYLGLWRKQAFWITLLGIFLFVIFVGAGASVVRAGVMGSLVLLAQYLGRPSRIFNVLIFTLAIMLFINPLSLLWDAGFQLSFMAVIGLVYLSPLIEEKFFKIKLINKYNWLGAIVKLLSATMSAIIFTLPLILYQFGRFSVVALLTNLLVLWIIPLLMLFGFLSLIFSFIYFPFGQGLAWITHLGLKYVILITEFFGQQKWSAVNLEFPFWGMISSYFILILWLNKKLKF